MSDPTTREQISVSYPAGEVSRPALTFTNVIGYLVFEAHALRLSLEITLCVFGYTLLFHLVPWAALQVPAKWSALFSWFFCCFVLVLFDQTVLCRSVHVFRRAYLLGLAGAHDKALQLLDSVGPHSTAFIPLPLPIYHLSRSELLQQAKEYEKCEAELLLAELCLAPTQEIAIARAKLYRQQGDLARSQQELQKARQANGPANDQALDLEEALGFIETRNDFWAAKRGCQKVLSAPNVPHFIGESSHVLAQAYFAVCQLWTGEAEEGLESLTRSIERLRSATIYVDRLRPILAQLLLERAYYYATHKQPTNAVIDYKLAFSLCAQPHLQNLCEKVKNELLDRYDVRLY